MLRTPRRSTDAHAHATASPATAPPPGLVVSKLGVQATASAGTARGLLCLKITLPKGDGTEQRWPLFSGSAPKLRSIPALYPLPASALRGANLATAAVLLSLPAAGSYPPPPADPAAQRPFIDVSATTGQVYIVIEPSPARRGRRESIGAPGTPGTPTAAAARERTEWLVNIEFEVEVEASVGPDELFKAVVPVPRCLDNVVRFHILPEDEENSDVSIATEPKVLPLPSSHFAGNRRDPGPSSPSRRLRLEDDWEDGEVPGAEGSSSDEDDDGSWLEGRFQSTDTLTLEWGFVPSVGAPPDLRLTPRWDNVRPSIGVTFDATLQKRPGPLSLEALLPDGWGWSELEIRGDGLISWRSTDESLMSRRAPTEDDSVATTVAADVFGSPRRINGLATLDSADDFSFELSSFADGGARAKPSHPNTPSRRRSLTAERATAALHKVSPRVPVPAALFELEFEPTDDDEDDDDDDEENRVLLLEGTLVPLPLTLVGPDAPVAIPFIRFDDSSLPTQSAIVCPNASFQESPSPATPASPTLCSTSSIFVGTFTWVDNEGNLVPPRPTVPVTGPIRLAVQRNIWGVQTISTAFDWPPRAAEVALVLPVSTVRVVQATCRGKSLARTVLPRDGSAEVRVAGGRGGVELVLEVADEKGVALPVFPGSTGDLQVELAGSGWDKLLAETPETSLKRVSDRGFTGDLSSPASITFAPSKPRETEKLSRKLVSWSTIINLLLLWVLVSLGQQVQRLRAEVAFIVDETNDIRTYGYVLDDLIREHKSHWEETEVPVPVTPPQPPVQKPIPPPVPVPVQPHVTDSPPVHDVPPPRREPPPVRIPTAPAVPRPNAPVSNSLPKGEVVQVHPPNGLGRVVFGQGGWAAWANHPSVRTVVSTLSYLWRTVVWILVPQ